MTACGLAPSEQAALDKLDQSVGKDPLTEAAMGQTSPAYQKHLEDFHQEKTEDARSQTTGDVQQSTTPPILPVSAPETTPDQSQSERSVDSQSGQLTTHSSQLTNSSPVAPEPIRSASTVADDAVEDLLGDGIDESDRLRAVQKRLQDK